MARSTYIYVILTKKGTILGTFTVKWECKRELEKLLNQHVWPDLGVRRFRDGIVDTSSEFIEAEDF
jgi:hypothetical protein